MDKISLSVPFILLSTRAGDSGETERRFLTPFGTLDLVLRPIWDKGSGEPYFQIDLKGDTENWFLPEDTFSEFKNTILYFVRELLQKHVKESAGDRFKTLRVRMKGSEMSLRMPM